MVQRLLRSISYQLPPFLYFKVSGNQSLLTAGHSSQVFLEHQFVNFCLYLHQDLTVEGTAKRKSVVLKKCPPGVALRMAVLLKVNCQHLDY